mmetsp:Transcript_12234/g.16000  ORF Transcript_12234/g.16000 Transcript_12234/m.16000 type:complete len:212 (-) Transcript_12234:48-683(-)
MPVSSSSPSSSSSSSSRSPPDADDIVLITDGVDAMAVTSSLLEDNDVPYFSRPQQSYIDSISSHPNPKADDINNNDIIFTWDDDDDNDSNGQKLEEDESATVTTTSTTLSRGQQRKNKRRSKKKKKSKSQHSLDHLKQQVSNLMGFFEEHGWFIPMPDDSTSGKVWSNRMYGADKKKQRKQNERQMLECRIIQLATVLKDDHDHDCATIVE